MGKIKLIAADMDGTLLNNQGEISAITAKIINKAIDKGVIFAMCTGRFAEHAVAQGRDAGILCSAIGSNGCSIYDGVLGKPVIEHFTAPETAQKIRCVLDSYPVRYNVHMHGCVANNDVIPHGLFIRFGDLMMHVFNVSYYNGKEALDRLLQGPVYKFYAYDFKDAGIRSKAAEELSLIPGIYLTASGNTNLEIVPKGIDKGTGIQELADYYHISLDNIMVFGDFDNDMPMFRKAKYPVAMGNASDEIKKAAFYVTDSNEEDGLAKAIEKFVLNQDA